MDAAGVVHAQTYVAGAWSTTKVSVAGVEVKTGETVSLGLLGHSSINAAVQTTVAPVQAHTPAVSATN
jgi:hypothetical protein